MKDNYFNLLAVCRTNMPIQTRFFYRESTVEEGAGSHCKNVLPYAMRKPTDACVRKSFIYVKMSTMLQCKDISHITPQSDGVTLKSEAYSMIRYQAQSTVSNPKSLTEYYPTKSKHYAELLPGGFGFVI